MIVSFTVMGVPVAQPRHRAALVVAAGLPAGVRHYIPGQHPIHDFKRAVALAAMEAMQDAGLKPCLEPIILQARFLLPRPGWLEAMQGRGTLKTRRWPRGEVMTGRKPDLDNLMKAAKDAATGILWKDDALVCGYGPETGKWWCALGETSRCELSFWTLDENRAETPPNTDPQVDLHEEDRR